MLNLNKIKTFISKRLYKYGYKVSNFRRDDPDLYSKYSNGSIFLNVGAGSFRHKRWINLDYTSGYYKGWDGFVEYNLMDLTPLPFEDNSVDLIYTSHTIEHVTDNAAANLFKEVFRVLKKGGGFRITAPDIQLAYQAYKRYDFSFFYFSRIAHGDDWHYLYSQNPFNASIDQLFLNHFASPLSTIRHSPENTMKFDDDQIQKTFKESLFEDACDFFTSKCDFTSEFSGNHITWWSHDKIMTSLIKCGFKDPYISGYGQSLLPPMRNTFLFDTTHPSMSLYVEVIK